FCDRRGLHSLPTRRSSDLFEELTAQAQRFIGGLQRRMELQGLNVESFLAYKQRLIDYLERFLSHLVLAAHEIAMTIQSIDPERRSEEHTSELQSLRHLVCR